MSIPLPKIVQPAVRALASIGVDSLDKLTTYTESEIAHLHGMGPKALNILKEELKRFGLAFKKY